MKKKLLLLLAFTSVAVITKAQSFSDDFEAYTSGSKLGPQSQQWTTWSNADGGSEDVNVVTTDAHSGTKSIYFSSTSSTGGPVDVVLPFGAQYNTGQIKFATFIKVPNAKSAYFNFQANTVIGQVWAIECHLNANKTFDISNTSGKYLSTTYPQGEWFEIRFEVNLNTNNWEVFVDSVSVGAFSNPINQIASLNIYPANASASYWVDDVSYEITPYVLPATNAAVTSLNINNGLVGQQKTPSVAIRNLGVAPITSFDLTINYNGTTITRNVTGVNISSLGSYSVNFTETITLLAGVHDATVTISNVNGAGSDGDAGDDTKTITLTPIVPAPGKIVVAEEGTGTWCQWCPRGAVFMDMMEDQYHGYFAGIAVHNNDPMAYAPYDLGVGAAIPGYPSVLMDRNPVAIDPSDLESDFLSKIVTPAEGIIKNGATLNIASRILKVSLSTTLQNDINGNYKIACVLTEDSVTGTGAGYNQVNAYAGGNNGVMGGYELLPNPVPANRMVYDHVARFIAPSFQGHPNAFASSTSAGTTSTHTFTFSIPLTWDLNRMNIVGLFISPSGQIANGSFSSVIDAVDSGYVAGTEVGGNVGINKLAGPDAIRIAPNPAQNISNVLIALKDNAEVAVEVYSMTGALVASKNYGELIGSYELPVNMNDLTKGIYLVRVMVDNYPTTIKLVKE